MFGIPIVQLSLDKPERNIYMYVKQPLALTSINGIDPTVKLAVSVMQHARDIVAIWEQGFL